MRDKKIKNKELAKDIQFFKDHCLIKFGYNITIKAKKVEKESKKDINELIITFNELIEVNKSYFKCKNPRLEMKNRERELILYRQIYYYIAFKWGYTKSKIGVLVGQDHTTVVHGINQLRNKIQIKDKLITNKFNYIYNVISTKFGVDGDVPYDIREEFNPKSILSSMLS